MPRRTSDTAPTRPARRCRIGSPTSGGALSASAKPRPNWRRRRRLRPKPSSKPRLRRNSSAKPRGARNPDRQPPRPRPRLSPKHESRIMKSKDGFVQAYNAQIVVDSAAQIIVAQDVTQSAADSGQLVPMTDAVETNLGRKPEQLSADAGYCSEANLEAIESRGIDGYVATGRARDAVAGRVKDEGAVAPRAPEEPWSEQAEPMSAATLSRVDAMRAKIKAGGHASPYRLRKQLPEPVFGQIKQARGFRQFLLRGF